MKTIWQVYKLVNPITELPFYIGLTESPLKDRLAAHISECHSMVNTLKQREIIHILKANETPKIELIAECETREKGSNLELYTIYKLHDEGINLSNKEVNKSTIVAANIKMPEKADIKSSCLRCGVEIVSRPGKRERKFCSVNCRVYHWNNNNKRQSRYVLKSKYEELERKLEQALKNNRNKS